MCAAADILTNLRILVVDDEPDLRLGLTRLLTPTGAVIASAASAEEALAQLASSPVDLVISDIRMPGRSGVDLLRDIKATHPAVEVILVTGFGTIELAVECLHAGAANFLTKPFDNDEILQTVAMSGRRILAARTAVQEDTSEEGIIAVDPGMLAVLELVRQVAATHVPVLINGESGTGKELVARAIHRRSGFAKPFVAVNCAALPDTLLESELFGFRRGAFTGADRNYEGMLRRAHGGTLFLDEIASMSPVFQSKLLRVLQEKIIRPLGSGSDEATDFRLIAACNRDLRKMVEAGQFREDLYYRLGVFHVTIPPLRERPADILPLARHFVRRAAQLCLPGSTSILAITADAATALRQYSWPGNVRELENATQRAVILGRGADLLPHHFFLHGASAATATQRHTPAITYEEAKQRLLADFQRQFLENILGRTGGNISHAAEECGLTRAAIQKMMKRLNIDRSNFEKA
ncbi:MAG: sigma-54 dependent transcriptional regulator [Bacteroidia bacterium]|nr:sigma-54 dependent transcriptional regulator [Bacteroidia bacterium]